MRYAPEPAPAITSGPSGAFLGPLDRAMAVVASGSRLVAAAVLAAAAFGLMAGSAAASVVDFDGQRYIYTGSPGERNQVSFLEFSGGVTIFDGGITPAEMFATQEFIDNSGCRPVGVSSVVADQCPARPWKIDVNDGDDTVRGSDSNDEIIGGQGNDVLEGGSGQDLVIGGDGDDVLAPVFGPSSARQTLDVDGPDVVQGGAGVDQVQYSGNTPVSISLNDQPDDGGAGEGDNIASDIENVDGTSVSDTIVGSAGANRIDAASGDNVVRGGGGDDVVVAFGGADQLFGEEGNDSLDAGGGSDALDGGGGLDRFQVDPAACSGVFCSAFGNDTVNSRDGVAEAYSCGLGSDTAIADALDRPVDCESVQLPPVAPEPDRDGDGVPDARDRCPTSAAATPDGCSTKSKASLKTASLRVPARVKRSKALRSFRVTVRCPIACAAVVEVRVDRATARRHGLGRRSTVVGSVRTKLAAGRSKAVTLKVTAKARRLLRRASLRSLSVRSTFTAPGQRVRKSGRLTVVR